MYFVAIPGQIVGGVALFAILATGLVEAWLDTARTSFAALPGL